MRSLMVKLVAAFLLTSVLGLGLSALLIRQSVAREFDDYVIAQRRTVFVNLVTSYYATNGSWDGVMAWGINQMVMRQGGAYGGPPGNPGAQNRPQGNDPSHRDEPIFFALVDAAGRVVVPFGPYAPGQIVGEDDRAEGEPIAVGGQTVGWVLTPQRDGFRNNAEVQYLQRTDSALRTATVIVMIAAVIVGVVLTRLMIRPLRELTEATQQIAGGKLHYQVPVRSRDEIGVLAMQFNRMSADLARSNQLRQQMTADIAHDLRTPLTVLSGYLESMRDEVLKPTPARFGTLYDETQILLHLVDDLHTLAMADSGDLALSRRPIAPGQLLTHVAATYQHAAEQHGVSLAVEADPELPQVEADFEQMARVLSNLTSNALRYTPEGGRIALRSRARAGAIEFDVADSGLGIEPEHLPNIFERFYRVDSSRHEGTGGSGLGLAITKSIVELHGGAIAVASTPGEGTTFTINLPLARPA